jgi:hypothetical protein
MKKLRRFKTFEEINFDFGDEDWENIEKEKMKMIDNRYDFLDFEIEYFIKCGFEFIPRIPGQTNPQVREIHKMFNLSIIKSRNNNGGITYHCTIRISGKNSGAVVEDLAGFEEESRIKNIKNLMKKIYLFMWNNGFDINKYEEEEAQRKELAAKMKDVDPYEEEDWVN